MTIWKTGVLWRSAGQQSKVNCSNMPQQMCACPTGHRRDADYIDVEWYQLSLPFASSILYGYAITCGTALTIFCKSSDIWCNNCARARLPRFCILQRWLKCVLLPPCFTEDLTLGRNIGGSIKTNTNFPDPCVQWQYFNGKRIWIPMFLFVFCQKSPHMFTIMVSIVCNGGKLTCGIRIQGNDLFNASKSF